MSRLQDWSTNLTIRRKFQILGLGLIVPFLLTLVLATWNYGSMTAEVSKTLDLSRRGDEAVFRASKVDALLLLQTSLHMLSLQAANPPAGYPDSGVFSDATQKFVEAEKEWDALMTPAEAPIRLVWSQIRDEFLVGLPTILNERLQVRQTSQEAFQKLEGLTRFYQEQLTSLAPPGGLLAQSRAIFSVLSFLQGRDLPYLNDQALAEWRRDREVWLATLPPSGPYRATALDYLRVMDAELVPTMEAWIAGRRRTDLNLLKYHHQQTQRFQQVATHLTEEARAHLDLVRQGLTERTRSQALLQTQSLVWIVALVAAALVGGVLLFLLLRAFERGLITPLTQATEWASRIRAGDYAARLALVRRDEIGVLSAALEHMALEVIQKTRETEEINRTLESTVAQRTSNLAQALDRLEAAQAKLVLSEKLAVLGTLAASMAHELNTPLAAILSANRTILGFLEAKASPGLEYYLGLGKDERQVLGRWVDRAVRLSGEYQPRLPRALYREVEERLRSWGVPEPEAQAEVWVELGLSGDQEDQRTWAPQPQADALLGLALEVASLYRMAHVIESATNQASRVVQSLQRAIRSGSPAGSVWFGLQESLDSSLELIGRQRLKEVEVRWDFDRALRVFGPAEDLAQVWLNLITNAVQAMAFRGTLTFEAEAEALAGGWRVAVRDTGPGIPSEVADKIFEPFFTTKQDQGGLGLGLDICRRHLQALGGTITCQSVPGDTVFFVSWPMPDSPAPVGG